MGEEKKKNFAWLKAGTLGQRKKNYVVGRVRTGNTTHEQQNNGTPMSFVFGTSAEPLS